MQFLDSKQPISAGEQKINEYVRRIRNGESKDSIFQGLSESFKSAIEKELALLLEREKKAKANDLIPSRIRGLPSEIAVSFLEDERLRLGSEKLNAILAKIRQEELKREEAKKQLYAQKYKTLDEAGREKYKELSGEAVEIIQALIKGEISSEGLAPEEVYVIAKLTSAFEDFRTQNPNAPFKFELGQEIDKEVYENLYHKIVWRAVETSRESAAKVALGVNSNVSISLAPKPIQEREAIQKKLPDEVLSMADFARKETLEGKESYINSLKNANEVLKNQSGLAELKSGVPTLVISDIHARREMVVAALARRISEKGNQTVYELLEKGEINVVCVGDLVHSEDGSKWSPTKFEKDQNGQIIMENGKYKYSEYGKMVNEAEKAIAEIMKNQKLDREKAEEVFKNDKKYEALNKKKQELGDQERKRLLDAEMVRGLGTVKMIADLIAKFPTFKACRGNHDTLVEQDVSKHSDEGKDTFKWTKDNMGDDLVAEWSKLEQTLPLMIIGDGVIVSHTSGAESPSIDEIKGRSKTALRKLSWTDNRTIESAEIKRNEEKLRSDLGQPEAVHIIGHRPVEAGTYRSQCDGKLIQINNDKEMTVAYIPETSKRKFNPDQDVFYL